MLDNIYLLFENNGKYFGSYDEAWKNHYKSNVKKVRYCFTPTMQLFNRVNELEKHARDYFNKSVGLDYINVISGEGYKQIKFIGEF